MKKKIALIAVNDYEKEKIFEKEFKEVVEKSDFEFLDLESSNAKDLVKKAKGADKVFFVFDAAIGININYSKVAKELCRQKVKPIQVITSADEEGVNLSYAQVALKDLWTVEDPTIREADMNFHTLFYSYVKKSYTSFADGFEYEKGFSALETLLKL